jgi:hypothetical protein
MLQEPLWPPSMNFAAIETVTQKSLENTWRKIEYRLDILRATTGAHVEVVLHSAVLIL